jgi:hypothetical protein
MERARRLFERESYHVLSGNMKNLKMNKMFASRIFAAQRRFPLQCPRILLRGDLDVIPAQETRFLHTRLATVFPPASSLFVFVVMFGERGKGGCSGASPASPFDLARELIRAYGRRMKTPPNGDEDPELDEAMEIMDRVHRDLRRVMEIMHRLHPHWDDEAFVEWAKPLFDEIKRKPSLFDEIERKPSSE